MNPGTHSSVAGAGASAAVPAQQAIRSLLRMNVGNDVLAVPIEDVREILQMTQLTPLPRTPDFVRGVMNLRGSVVPVIDLAARLGHAATEVGRRSCIVVVEAAFASGRDEPDTAEDAPATARLVVGLLVDAVFEVFDRAAHEIEPAPPLGTRVAAESLLGMTRAGGSVIGVLALSQVLCAHDLAEAIAAHQTH
jgi:purine-binding chemotaxis protein CheW